MQGEPSSDPFWPGRRQGPRRHAVPHVQHDRHAFSSPVVELSASGAKARLVGNLVSDGGTKQKNQKVADARGDAKLQDIMGGWNWFSGNFSRQGTGLDARTNRFVGSLAPLFANPVQNDYHLLSQAARTTMVRLAVNRIELPETPGALDTEVEPPLVWQYRHPAAKEKRPPERALTAGASLGLPFPIDHEDRRRAADSACWHLPEPYLGSPLQGGASAIVSKDSTPTEDRPRAKRATSSTSFRTAFRGLVSRDGNRTCVAGNPAQKRNVTGWASEKQHLMDHHRMGSYRRAEGRGIIAGTPSHAPREVKR